jgi:IS5 family transposase
VGRTAYRFEDNLRLLDRRGLVPQFQRRKPRGKPMPAHIRRGNTTRTRVRAKVEHVFAAEKRRLHLVIRTVGQARSTAKIILANLAYNFTCLAWLTRQAAA